MSLISAGSISLDSNFKYIINWHTIPLSPKNIATCLSIYSFSLLGDNCTGKKEKKISPIYKEILKESVAKSYMTKGILIVKYLLISSY